MSSKGQPPDHGSDLPRPSRPRGEHFHYLDDLVALEPADVNSAADIVEGRALDVGLLAERMGYDIEYQGEVLDELLSLVGVLQVAGDPLLAAQRLDDHDIAASTVRAMGTMNHWATMSGTEPSPVDPSEDPKVAPVDDDLVIAAIDSGVTRSMPGWLESGLEYETPIDLESPNPRVASHGVFVTGLIRSHVKKGHVIRIARSRSRPINDFRPPLRPVDRHGHDPSTELDLLEAMIRLVHALEGRNVAALNLSLGGYTDADDPLLTTTRKAIDLWLDRFPKAPIFAPAGNRDDRRTVHPAAFDEVRGIAATDNKGREVVWDEHGHRVPAPNRPWVDDSKPGVDVIGPSGVRRAPWVEWSGSSFSTALATAEYVNSL